MLIKKNKIPVLQLATIGLLPSFLKKIIYRIKGYKIAKKVKLGLGSVIIGDNVNIGEGSSIGFITVLRGRDISLGRFVKIGSMTMIDCNTIKIDEDARINENVIVGGTPSRHSMLDVGKRAIIMQNSFINTTMPVTIGDDSGIGGHCLLFTHGSWLSKLDGFPVSFAPITLGKKVWLPWRVFIMPGVTIGDEVIIGANSLINRDLPSNVLAAGSPAKILKTNITERPNLQERINIIENYITEFIDHLEYHNFEVNRKDSEKSIDFTATDIKNRQHHFVYIKDSDDQTIDADSPDVVLMETEKPIDSTAKMKLNTLTNKREGSSALGEEFLNFISRFGTRFDRLD
jgi:acetyltransferase-like isoleucine patch superfamily enzyme